MTRCSQSRCPDERPRVQTARVAERGDALAGNPARVALSRCGTWMKRPISPFIFVALLAGLAVAVLVVGLHDAAVASGRVGLTALSVLLLIVGVVLLVAATSLLGLRTRGSWADGA